MSPEKKQALYVTNASSLENLITAPVVRELEAHDYEVSSAESVRAAIKQIHEKVFDLVITDLFFLERAKGGIEIVQLAAQEGVKIIFLIEAIKSDQIDGVPENVIITDMLDIEEAVTRKLSDVTSEAS